MWWFNIFNPKRLGLGTPVSPETAARILTTRTTSEMAPEEAAVTAGAKSAAAKKKAADLSTPLLANAANARCVSASAASAADCEAANIKSDDAAAKNSAVEEAAKQKSDDATPKNKDYAKAKTKDKPKDYSTTKKKTDLDRFQMACYDKITCTGVMPAEACVSAAQTNDAVFFQDFLNRQLFTRLNTGKDSSGGENTLDNIQPNQSNRKRFTSDNSSPKKRLKVDDNCLVYDCVVCKEDGHSTENCAAYKLTYENDNDNSSPKKVDYDCVVCQEDGHLTENCAVYMLTFESSCDESGNDRVESD